MKYGLISILFWLLISKLAAQTCQFSGQVALADNEDRAGIMVQLLDTTANRLFQFRTTDSTGYFKFSNLKKGPYKIRITQFGYQDTVLLAHCKAADIAFKPLQLKPLSINLEGISVIDKAILMKKSGDTTIFNLKAIETGSEQSVSDIMRKIPGFSINGSQYLFQNQPIKKVLIDGKDIADNDHLEFTDAIHYKTVEDIRVIENYSGAYQPYPDQKENEIAMDITLKATYKNKYQGTLSMLGGYNHIYDVAVTVLRAGQKTAFKVLFSSTNSDKNISQFDVSNIVREASNDILFKSRHHLVSQMNHPQDLDLYAANFYRLNYHSVKAAMDSRLSKKSTLKSNASLRRLNGRQDIQGIRQFFSDISSSQNYAQSNTQSTWLVSLDNYLSIAFDTSANLEIEWPVHFKGSIQRNSENGIFFKTSYQNENEHNDNAFYTQPIYKFHKTFSNKLTLSVFGRNGFLINSGARDISSKDSIAGMSVFDPENSLFQTNQTQAYVARYFNNQIRLRKKVQDFDIQYNLCFEKNSENLTNESSYSFSSPFIGTEKLAFTNLTHSLRTMYDKRPFKFGLGLVYAHTNIQTAEDREENQFFRPNLFFLYRLNSKWNISSSYVSSFYQASLLQVNSLQTLVSQFNLWEGDASIRDIAASDAYNFSLFRSFEIGEEATLFNSMISFIPKSTEIHPVYEVESFYQVKSYQLLRKRDQIRLQFQYNKKYRTWNYDLHFSAGQSALEVEEGNIEDNYLAGSAGFNYFQLKYFKISSKIDVSISERESGLSKSLNLYVRPVVSLSFERKLFQGTIWYQLRYNQIAGGVNTYHGLNAEFSRKKAWKNFELNLKFYDVLNLVSANLDFTTFNPMFIQTDTYRSFPGQILAGVKWYFGTRD